MQTKLQWKSCPFIPPTYLLTWADSICYWWSWGWPSLITSGTHPLPPRLILRKVLWWQMGYLVPVSGWEDHFTIYPPYCKTASFLTGPTYVLDFLRQLNSRGLWWVELSINVLTMWCCGFLWYCTATLFLDDGLLLSPGSSTYIYYSAGSPPPLQVTVWGGLVFSSSGGAAGLGFYLWRFWVASGEAVTWTLCGTKVQSSS